jgi:hypothetical protein
MRDDRRVDLGEGRRPDLGERRRRGDSGVVNEWIRKMENRKIKERKNRKEK